MKISNLITQRLERMRNEFISLCEYITISQEEIEKISEEATVIISEMEKITKDKNIANNIKYISLNEKSSSVHKITLKIRKIENDMKDSLRKIGEEKNVILEMLIDDNKSLPKKVIEQYLSDSLKIN